MLYNPRATLCQPEEQGAVLTTILLPSQRTVSTALSFACGLPGNTAFMPLMSANLNHAISLACPIGETLAGCGWKMGTTNESRRVSTDA